MDLDPTELRELAAFCARRFSTPARIAELAHAAGLPLDPMDGEPPETAWERVWAAAQDAQRVPQLARALAAAAPEDANLQAACRELTGSAGGGTVGTGSASARGKRWLAATVGVAAMACLAWAIWPAAPAPPEPPVTELVVAERAQPAAPTPAPSAAPTEAPPTPPAAPAPGPAVATTASPRSLPAGCAAPDGQLIGWWYAGRSRPGAAGETITLDRSARVRTDYPKASNHYNARAPERCVLPPGTRLHLSRAPVDASTSQWWVPYVGGDAVR